MPVSSLSANAIKRAPSPAHPLTSPRSPNFPTFPYDVASSSVTPSAAASSSSFLSPHSNSTPTFPGSISPSQTVQRRKGHLSTPSSPINGTFLASGSGTIDSDVTRPGLKRVNDSTNHLVNGISADLIDGVQEVSGRSSLDGLSRRGSLNTEKEVVVHTIARTDSIASISLKYGITPQALRTSNRLWPSDSIHLRKTLNIPLDKCHLPTSSAGIERIVREEDGNLVVWERDQANSVTPNSSQPELSSSFASSSRNSLDEPSNTRILSPRVRRLISTSSIEPNTAPDLDTQDLINIWGTAALPATRNGYNHSNSKGKERALDDSGANYLSSTHNIYSNSTSPAPLLSFSPSLPADLNTKSNILPSDSELNPFARETPPNGLNGTAPDKLSKRVLTIAKIPVSELSFFPPASNSNQTSADTSARSSLSVDETMRTGNDRNLKKKPSLFGPLTNSLAKLALGNGNSSTSRWISSTGLSPEPPNSIGLSSWAKKWDLSYFGGEEEDAANSGWNSANSTATLVGLQQVQGWNTPPRSDSTKGNLTVPHTGMGRNSGAASPRKDVRDVKYRD